MDRAVGTAPAPADCKTTPSCSDLTDPVEPMDPWRSVIWCANYIVYIVYPVYIIYIVYIVYPVYIVYSFYFVYIV